METQAKTLDEVVKRLQELSSGDPEVAHGEADLLLLDALLIMNHSDVVSAYQEARDRVGFWYA